MIDAMKQALEALEWIVKVNAMDYEYKQKAAEPITALRQAIAEAEKQPSTSGVIFAVEQAIEAGDCPIGIVLAYEDYEAKRKESALQEITDIGQEIEQEPVAYRKEAHGMWFYIENKPSPPNDDYEPLYTAPPKREWVGLDDNEIQDTEHFCGDVFEFARAIEAKLREKNT